MTSAVVPCLALLGAVLLLHVLLRRGMEMALCVTVSTFVLLLYLGGLIGCLRAFRIALLIGGGLAGLTALVLAIASPSIRARFKGLVSPGMVFFFVAFAASCIAYRDAELHQWDEFSHWGPHAKYIAGMDELYGPRSSVFLPDYPPGGALLQYYMLAGGPFSEARLYLAQGVLILAALSVLVGCIPWRRPEWAILQACGVVLLVSIVDFDQFPSLYMDLPMAVLFAACVVGYTSSVGARTRRDDLCTAVMVGLLPLLKDIGVVFALILVGVMVLDWTIDRLATRRGQRAPSEQGAGRLPRSVWWSRLAILVLVMFTQVSWSVRHTRLGGTPSHALSEVSATEVLAGVFGRGTQHQEKSRRMFGTAILEDRLAWSDDADRLAYRIIEGVGIHSVRRLPRITTLPWVLVFVAASAFAVLVTRDARHRRAVISTCCALLIGLGVYFFVLLLTFMFIFGPVESEGAVGYERFVGTLVLPMLLTAQTLLLRSMSVLPAIGLVQRMRAVAWPLLSLAGLYVYETPKLPFSREIDTPDHRVLVRTVLGPVLQHVPREATVSLVCQHTVGYEFYILGWELFPRQMVKPWSLGSPYEPSDVWTHDLSPSAWRDLLAQNHVSYLVVLQADDQFWRKYGVLFSPAHRPQDFLFRVPAVGLFEAIPSSLFRGTVAPGAEVPLLDGTGDERGVSGVLIRAGPSAAPANDGESAPCGISLITGRGTLSIPWRVFGTPGGQLSLFAQGSWHLKFECPHGPDVLDRAGRPPGWYEGYCRVASRRQGSGPLEVPLYGIEKITGARVGYWLRNFENDLRTRYHVGTFDDRGTFHLLRAGSVYYLSNAISQSLPADRANGAVLRLGIDVERKSQFWGVELLSVRLEGRFPGWEENDRSIRLLNRLAIPIEVRAGAPVDEDGR